MIKLLKVEWMKIRSYNAFIVISAFFALGVFASNYLAYSFKKNVIDPADPTGLISAGSPFGFPSVWLSPIALFTTVICVINVWLISEARALFGRAQLHILGLMR